MDYKEQICSFIPEDIREENEKRVVLDYIAKFPDSILTRENEFAHITSSGFIMNQKLDKVLFIFHRIYDTWTWTGGHADGETNLLETAIREAREETGINRICPLTEKMISIDIIPVFGHIKNGKYVCSHLHLNATYVLIADELSDLSVKKDEASDVQWIQASDIAKYSNEPYLVDIYNKIIRKAKALKHLTDDWEN